MTINTPDKSPDLLKAEAQAKARATVEALKQEPVPTDTVTYRTEIDPNAGRMKRVPITQLDVNDDLVDEYQARADAQNRMFQAEEDARSESAHHVNSLLTATEKRINLERYYTPILNKLTEAHTTLCDQVAEFEDNERLRRLRIQSDWAFEGKHPEVKQIYSAGPQHFKHLLTSGAFNIDGYKLADQRKTTGDASIIFLIPSEVPSLMSYSDSLEAKAVSQTEYQRDLDRLITKRKQAAVKLTETRMQARDALAAIPTFEDLLSDGIKRALKK